jgi:propanediol dehydratase small subunit
LTTDIQLNGQSLVTTSATTSPASGTTETWTVTALAAAFPALQTGVTSHSLIDATSGATTSQQAEIIRVTASTGSGATSITVTRGADGTTPVAHAATSTFNVTVVASALTALMTDSANLTTRTLFR